MMSLSDLHIHALPGLDDGPATLDESVVMFRRCHDMGIRRVVATPHLFHPLFGNVSRRRIEEVFDETLTALNELARSHEDLRWLAELEIALGAENYFSSEFMSALEDGLVLTVNDSRYVLLEFSPYVSFEAMQNAAGRVLSSGYFPLLAHVERYDPLQRDPGRLSALVAMGCATQVNADSILAPRLSSAARAVHRFIKADLIDIVASDAHGVHTRASRMAEAAKTVRRKWGEDRVNSWMVVTPSRIAGFGTGAD